MGCEGLVPSRMTVVAAERERRVQSEPRAAPARRCCAPPAGLRVRHQADRTDSAHVVARGPRRVSRALAKLGVMTGSVFRSLALSLPEAHESPHFERASFRVGTTIFATLTADGREAMVRVSPPERLFALLSGHPDVFFEFGGWTVRYGSLGVKLAKIDRARMRELLVDSWSKVAPRSARAALSAGR